MTKEQFKKTFPDGVNATIANFEKSLYEIMNGEEIDRVIKYTKGKEKRFLKKFKNLYRDNVSGWCALPIWGILPCIESPELLKNVIAYMVSKDKTVYDGSEKND